MAASARGTMVKKVFLLMLGAAALSVPGGATRLHAASAPAARATIISAPLVFEPNQGQFEATVRFVSRTKGYTLGLTDSGAVITLGDRGSDATGGGVLRLTFDGALSRQPVALDRAPGVINYLIGNDPARWRTGVPLYSRVTYDDVYPGVDVVYYGNDGTHEYDLVVAPGADPTRIAMRVTGADRIDRDTSGGLQLVTAAGTLTLRSPTLYQLMDGERQTVDAHYAIDGESIHFDLGDYDTSATLIIDPQLVYGTFLGGTGNGVDQANGVAVDAAGNAYVVGTSETTDFPTQSPLQGQRRGQSDAVVTKLSPDGRLVYSTYLGGDSFDYGADIDVRDDGTAYVAGETTSTNFPLNSPYQDRYRGNTDGFVVELNPQGTAITNGTYLGGSDTESVRGLQLTRLNDVADSDNVFGDWLFVYGSTKSPDFPLEKPQQASRAGEQDGFVTVFVRETLRPNLSTYIGKSGGNTAGELVLNRERGDMYLLLRRNDDNGPLMAQFKPRSASAAAHNNGTLAFPVEGPSDAELAVIAWEGEFEELEREDRDRESFERQKTWHQAAIASCKDPKQLKSLKEGLTFAKMCAGIAPSLDDFANPTIRTAVTPSELERAVLVLMWPLCIPVAPAASCTERGSLIYFDEDRHILGHVNYGGQRGSRPTEFTAVRGIADRNGQLQIVGQTTDPALPLKNAVQGSYLGSTEVFALTLHPATGEASFLTYLGGGSFDTVTDVAVDAEGNRWIVGSTQSANFPTTRSGVQPELRGRVDSFVVKISP